MGSKSKSKQQSTSSNDSYGYNLANSISGSDSFNNSNSISNSNSTSNSSGVSLNQNKDLINSLFTGQAQNGGLAGNAMAALLGLGGDPSAQQDAFSKFRDGTGYQFQMDQGLGAVNGGASAGGTLGSGARDKALLKYSQGLADNSFNGYLQQLSGLSGQGMQAGGLLSGAGQFSSNNSNSVSNSNSLSNSLGGSSSLSLSQSLGENMATGQSQSTGSTKSSDKSGLTKDIGNIAMAAAAASDPRLKENIEKIGELPDGLGVYTWNYIWDAPEERYKGVMADEVSVLRPWALGPEIGGYKSVDYSKLMENGDG